MTTYENEVKACNKAVLHASIRLTPCFSWIQSSRWLSYMTYMILYDIYRQFIGLSIVVRGGGGYFWNHRNSPGFFSPLKAVLFRSDKPLKTSDVDFQLYTFVAFGVWTAYLPATSDPCTICAWWYRNKTLNSSATAMLRPENLNWKSSPGRRGFRGPPTEKKNIRT